MARAKRVEQNISPIRAVRQHEPSTTEGKTLSVGTLTKPMQVSTGETNEWEHKKVFLKKKKRVRERR